MAPPSERKNVVDAVATPRSFQSTAFCTASTTVGIVMPMPNPRISIDALVMKRLDSGVICESPATPIVPSPVPMTGKIL